MELKFKINKKTYNSIITIYGSIFHMLQLKKKKAIDEKIDAFNYIKIEKNSVYGKIRQIILKLAAEYKEIFATYKTEKQMLSTLNASLLQN